MDHGTLFILLACLFGLIMTWGVGANDLANVMSTSIGSNSITIRQAIIIAILFEFLGAYLGGMQVSNTIRHGIINTDVLVDRPELFVYGMISVLMAAMTWMTLASYLGLPVSITHTIVGAIVGFGAILLGINAIQWHKVSIIAISWITSPLLAAIFAYLLFILVQQTILARDLPFRAAKRLAPFYLFLIGIAMSFASVVKGLAHLGLHLTKLDNTFITVGTGLLITISGMLLVRRINLTEDATRHEQFEFVEKIFSVFMLFTAAAMVFAHGSNDVAIAVGPIAAVVDVVQSGGNLLVDPKIPYWIVVLGAGGVVIGLLTYGRNVIETVGNSITLLTPSRAFAATLSAAFTVVIATSAGIPVSATQTLVGAVLGVGLARGIGALNLSVIRNIFMSWVITIPAGALFTMGYFYLFRITFGK